MTTNAPPANFSTENNDIAFPYFLSYAEDHTDLWKVNSTSLEHITSIPEPVSRPLLEGGIIVDHSREAIIVAHPSGPTCLLVYNIRTGRQIKKVSLFGTISSSHIQYDNGRVLLTVQDRDSEEDWTLLCNLFDDEQGDFLSEIRCSTADDPNTSYTNAFLSGDGGVVVAAGKFNTESPMKLLYWPSDGQPDDSLPSTHSIDIPTTMPEADAIVSADSAALGDGKFVLSTVDASLGFLDGPETYRSTLRAHTTPSLEVLWSAPPIWGKVKTVQYVSSLDIVIAIGRISEREHPTNSDSEDYAHFIVALDAQTGEQKQYVRVNHRKQGTAVVGCGLIDGGKDAPQLGFMLRKGSVVTTSLSEFLAKGLAFNDAGALEPSYHIHS